MTPRRRNRRRRHDDLMRAVQRLRLQQIARGETQPRYDREFYFLWTLQKRGRADYDDFILPGLLFRAEHELGERKAAGAATAEAGAEPEAEAGEAAS